MVNESPKGVIIKMIDGTLYSVPHRDWVWFTPATEMPESRVGRFATSFYVAVDGIGHLVNALLVAEITPIIRPSNESTDTKNAA